jgi:hypothetical protein
LGASCLTLKIAYQIGIWSQLTRKVRHGWIEHIRQFQRKSTGFFEDPTLLKVADRNAGPLWFKKKDMAVRRAETRQASAALLGVCSHPLYPVWKIPDTPRKVANYLSRLPWAKRPWHSGSHASHLAFFLKLNADLSNQQERYQELMPVILNYLDALQDPGTGSWSRASVPIHEQINTAMKILTIYRLLGDSFRWPERLIDLCLSERNDRDACNSVDVLFVLYESSQWTSYRGNEIMMFAEHMLDRIRRHFKLDGAFSFYPDRTNTTYYGVPVSKGFAESDVHGTHLLVWAITLCASLLGFQSELGWRFPIT